MATREIETTASFVDGEEFECAVCGRRVEQGQRSLHVNRTDEWVCSESCAERSVVRCEQNEL